MFRKPREPISSLADIAPQAPSTGRPPTPPDSSKRQHPSAYSENPTMAVPTTPLLGRSKTAPKPTPRTSSASKAKPTGNGNILNFFQKTVPPKSEVVINGEKSLFLDDDDFGTGPAFGKGKVVQTPTPPKDPGENLEELDGQFLANMQASRYNEDDGPVKRRKIGGGGEHDLSGKGEGWGNPSFSRSPSFDDDVGRLGDWNSETKENEPLGPQPDVMGYTTHQIRPPVPVIPALKQETTSYSESNDFEGIEDFIDDEFPEEGEEYLERKWMQEQADLEMGLENDDADAVPNGKVKEEGGEVDTKIVMHDEEATSCPLCATSLSGITDQVCFRPDCQPYSFNGTTGSFVARQCLPGWQASTTSEPHTTCQVRTKPIHQQGEGSSAQALPESRNSTTRPAKPVWAHNHARDFNIRFLDAYVWPRRGCSMGQRSSRRNRLERQASISTNMSLL